MATCKEEYERIKELQGTTPTFISKEHLLNDILPLTALATGVAAVTFFALSYLVRRLAPKSSSYFVHTSARLITMTLFNATKGIMGIHYCYTIVEENPSIDTMVMGYRNAYPLACVLLGKYLFAITAELIIDPNASEMIVHHLASLLVACMSIFPVLGFNYYNPFMFGVFEITSVPLAGMDFFKHHPEYMKTHPLTYTVCRMIFCFSFLYIRWYLFFPRLLNFLRLYAFKVVTCESRLIQLLSFLAWLGSFFLLVLQIYWGVLIVKGLCKFFSTRLVTKQKKAA